MGVNLANLLLFLFGICLGSFLNVVVYRLNHGLSPLQGRSFCPQCKKKITWRDNLPLFSFLLLRGHCRSCHSPISWQYPLVELATGILTLFTVHYSLLFFDSDLLVTVYSLLITYILITIFVSDWCYTTIPDQVVYFGIGLALIKSLVNNNWLSLLMGALAAGFILLLVMTTRGKGMGIGDVKLAGLMGLILGFPRVLIALILAFLTGAIVGVILVLLGRKSLKEHVPFGPFLTGATWVSLFWGEIIWQDCLIKILGF